MTNMGSTRRTNQFAWLGKRPQTPVAYFASLFFLYHCDVTGEIVVINVLALAAPSHCFGFVFCHFMCVWLVSLDPCHEHHPKVISGSSCNLTNFHFCQKKNKTTTTTTKKTSSANFFTPVTFWTYKCWLDVAQCHSATVHSIFFFLLLFFALEKTHLWKKDFFRQVLLVFKPPGVFVRVTFTCSNVRSIPLQNKMEILNSPKTQVGNCFWRKPKTQRNNSLYWCHTTQLSNKVSDLVMFLGTEKSGKLSSNEFWKAEGHWHLVSVLASSLCSIGRKREVGWVGLLGGGGGCQGTAVENVKVNKKTTHAGFIGGLRCSQFSIPVHQPAHGRGRDANRTPHRGAQQRSAHIRAQAQLCRRQRWLQSVRAKRPDVVP